MARERVLSTRLFYFEQHANGFFKRPEAYPQHSVAPTTTHDLPTVAGYWRGRDIAVHDMLDSSRSSHKLRMHAVATGV